MSWSIDRLPEGSYGARAYQDLDQDRELDKNRIGLPTEPFGFSNDATPRLGPPGWRRVKFSVPVKQPIRFRLRGGWKKAEEIAQAFERRFGEVTDDLLGEDGAAAAEREGAAESPDSTDASPGRSTSDPDSDAENRLDP